MNAVTHIAPPASNAAPTLFAQRRMAIDLIATSRAKAIRVELFANYLCRKNPTQQEEESTRQSWRETLREQLNELDHARQMVSGEDKSGQVARDIVEWISETAKTDSKHLHAFETIVSLTQAVVTAAEADNIDALQKAIEAHQDFRRKSYFQTVTAFLEILWSDLDEHRDKEVARANATASAIGKTLRRLEHIGKHVRLVSLNASVEAARVGEEGRGLGVIAVEFKTLAEEIQHLATTARADVSEMERQSEASSET